MPLIVVLVAIEIICGVVSSSLPPTQQDPRPANFNITHYNPTFNSTARHDPAQGWVVAPDNMPIGNGRLVANVWCDGHNGTSGIGVCRLALPFSSVLLIFLLSLMPSLVQRCRYSEMNLQL